MTVFSCEISCPYGRLLQKLWELYVSFPVQDNSSSGTKRVNLVQVYSYLYQQTTNPKTGFYHSVLTSEFIELLAK